MDVRLLGPIEVVDGAGRVVEIPGARPRALLALLALHTPNAVHVDRIVEDLWGDESASSPEAALHVAVSRLRGTLGEDIVATVPGGYRLEIPVANSDVERFRKHALQGQQFLMLGHPGKAAESFRQALAQWRGTPLMDLRHFEFAEQAARVLEEERLATVEALMEAEIEAGQHDQVIGELSGLVEAFPLRERLWGHLMLALYRSGRQAEALRAYQEVRALLGQELGVEPSEPLRELEERILLHDPALEDRSGVPVDEWPEEPELLNFPAGEVIVQEGARADAVYWIESGHVEVLRSHPDGEPTVLAELWPGHYFGELASLLGTGRTATVRAVTPTTVSVHSVDSFRSRLGVERARDAPRRADNEAVRELLGQGQYLQAYDAAMEHLERGSADPELRYLAVLSLKRTGAISQARRRYDSLGLGSIDPEAISPALREEVVALAAGLDKEVALGREGEERLAWSRRSAEAYQSAFERGVSAYLAVNAATMWLVGGESERARSAAKAALSALENDKPSSQEERYWHAVTEAEAALVLADVLRAGEALERAGHVSQRNWAARATTLKQLKLVCDYVSIDPGILSPIRNPSVAHFCGHRILPEGHSGRFPITEEQRIAQQIQDTFERLHVGVGIGSLAAGADILAAEALLARDAELQVVLPFERDEFVRTSVAPAGSAWVRRFERCLARATNVVTAISSEFLGDPVLFDFCAQIAMGDTLMRGRFLEADVHQVAVWDGTVTNSVAGTSADVAHWESTGRSSTIIPVDPGPTPELRQVSGEGRRITAIVFADFAGYSKLSDAQLVVFQDVVMSGLARALEPYRPQLLSGRTWGDGLYLVFDDVAAAASSALVLQDTTREMDFQSAGLGPLRGMRVAAHATPVFDGWDPIAGSRLFYGAGVTQTARIEPRTPEGEIYTTHAFAALAMLAGDDTFDCQYVGTTPAAKGYGSFPLFTLRRRLQTSL